MNRDFSALCIAANGGDSHAQCRYALRLGSGDGIAKDLVLAAHFYKLSADQGNSDAQCHYGVCLRKGKGVAEDRALAVHYFKLSADQGNSAAQSCYGWCLAHGDGVAMDKALAVHYYKLSAYQGNSNGQGEYGWCLAKGEGVAVDKVLAAHFFKLAADQGNSAAQYNCGWCLTKGEGVAVDKALAANYFKLSADQGDAGGQCDYGLCLANGEGVAVDKVLAANYFKLSADQGNSNAQCHYGLYLANGEGVAVDRALAAHYFKLSADQGNSNAQCHYGLCLANGEGVAVDRALVANYFKLSADQGNSNAQCHYGWCLENGEGVAMDKALALDHYRLSADQGLEAGIFHCARLLAAGEDRALAADYAKRWAACVDGAPATPEALALRAACALPTSDFAFVINGTVTETSAAAAAALSPAVALQLSVDPCARTFAIDDPRICGRLLPAFARLLAGGRLSRPSLLGSLARPLGHPALEGMLLPRSSADSISLLSVDALDALLSEAAIALDGEDSLLSALLDLGPEYLPLLRHVQWGFVSDEALARALEVHAAAGPSESLWLEIRRFGRQRSFDSAIVSELPAVLAQLGGRHFALLWRGSRDGFGARDFHARCDGHANTVTLIRDTRGNIFGGFTPLLWDPRKQSADLETSADHSGGSFLFTLKNPHGVPPRKFRLTAKHGLRAIAKSSAWGPNFCDIGVSGGCNANARSFANSFGHAYTNDTGQGGKSFFAGAAHFTVQEVEVFEVRRDGPA
jgi:TPR repeat protein